MSMRTKNLLLGAPTAGPLDFNRNVSSFNKAQNAARRPDEKQPGEGQSANTEPSSKTIFSKPATGSYNKVLGTSNQPVTKSNASTLNKPQSLDSLKGFFNHENKALPSNSGKNVSNQIPVTRTENNQQNSTSTKEFNIPKGKHFRLTH